MTRTSGCRTRIQQTSSTQQIALIKQWIEEGADWKGHWSYIPPAKPTTMPAETIEGFTRNPIDGFVAEKMTAMGLKPSPEADRVTQIRRLSFDLIGLPPTHDEVEAFVNDKSPDAYEKVVERLLANPHYGERMSGFWMDLVRYGDTIGFHSDNPREVWPWRDWCINAFNRNEPFNQFTIEQIAGDLIRAYPRAKVASAYNRLLLTTGEGGAGQGIHQKYEGDRVRNVATTWLGVTMGCCHARSQVRPFARRIFTDAFFADIRNRHPCRSRSCCFPRPSRRNS